MSPTSRASDGDTSLPGEDDGVSASADAALSIEAFAASIAASLVAEAPAAREPEPPLSRGERLALRDRARRRLGKADVLVFRVAGELFAVELIASEEALDMPLLHQLPEMPPDMLGVFTLRGALVSVFAPRGVLGVAHGDATTVVVFAGVERRIALAVDDVDDVLTIDLRTLRDAPGTESSDGVLLGVVHRGRDLIGILDADALLAAFRSAAAAVPDAKESA